MTHMQDNIDAIHDHWQKTGMPVPERAVTIALIDQAFDNRVAAINATGWSAAIKSARINEASDFYDEMSRLDAFGAADVGAA